MIPFKNAENVISIINYFAHKIMMEHEKVTLIIAIDGINNCFMIMLSLVYSD